MAMKPYWETTEWDVPAENHVYFLDDSMSKMYAHVVRGSAEVFQFKRPIQIDTRGRTFVAVPNIWNFTIEETVVPTTQWTFAGSKGAEYIVKKEENSYNCTCPGFKFRGECKHIKSIE